MPPLTVASLATAGRQRGRYSAGRGFWHTGTLTESLEPIVKIGVYAALLILVGAHAARWLVRAAPEWTGRDRGSVDRRFARLGAITAAVLVVLLGVRLVAHSAAAFGLADALSMENLTRDQERYRTQFSHMFSGKSFPPIPFGTAAFEALRTALRRAYPAAARLEIVGSTVRSIDCEPPMVRTVCSRPSRMRL